jgi:hypothetical protein
MASFGMTIEDPFYDEDGVLIDEDSALTELDTDEYIDPNEWDIAFPPVSYNPFDTVNS